MSGRTVCRIYVYGIFSPLSDLHIGTYYFHIFFPVRVCVCMYCNESVRTKQIQSDGDTNMRLRQYAYDNAINRVFSYVYFFLIHGDRSDVLHNMHVSFYEPHTDSTSSVQLIDFVSGKYFFIRVHKLTFISLIRMLYILCTLYFV